MLLLTAKLGQSVTVTPPPVPADDADHPVMICPDQLCVVDAYICDGQSVY